MRAVEALLLLAVLIAIAVLVAGKLLRTWRAKWELREESDGAAMKVLAVKTGQEPLVVARVPFDVEDFDSQLFEARSEGRARVRAMNQKS
jgi:hypothetical protein